MEAYQWWLRLLYLCERGTRPARHPAEWMPWNYRQTLERAGV
jgi:hypothetical protein